MPLPAELIASLRGAPGFEEEAFLSVHEQGAAPVSVRLNPAKGDPARGELLPSAARSRVPWCSPGWYLASRPSFILDPAWHAGLYYVQEASSMFVEQAFRQHTGVPAPRVLDACAAPGGKSTHLQTLIGDGLLVSNEVIRTRVGVLSENLQRWGGANVLVSAADPRDFGALAGFFDIILVDAPCSGSGLFRREPEAVREWSLQQVELCGGRQQRILSDLWGSLKEGGLLIYSTCSYSPRENEVILDWLSATYAVESMPLALEPEWGVVESRAPGSGAYGYRFYPNKLEGEGLFMACLRKRGAAAGSPASSRSRASANPRGGASVLGSREVESIRPWIAAPDDYIYLLTGETVRAIPAMLAEDVALLSAVLPVRQAGIAVGQPIRRELIPDPALALSLLTSENVPRLELTQEQALDYVRKDELRLEGAPRGWALVTYGRHGLGWVKVLEGRINNYYPKPWRVMKK